jgi:hypothetical protein
MTLGAKIRTNIEAPFPTLIAFGISVAVTIAIAVGIAGLTDPSHAAHATTVRNSSGDKGSGGGTG